MTVQTTRPDLESRFQEPEGWRWHGFERNGRQIRFGSVFPQDSIPDAVVVCLQGVREFCEKYFEVARWCNDHNLAFWVVDWVGQGKSTRYFDDLEKRHNNCFSEDVLDFHEFVLGYIKHSSVHPDRGRIPMAMLGHSMGGNIGLRTLHDYPDLFECAAFSSPMIGIKALRNVPPILATGATTFCNAIMGSRKVPDTKDAFAPRLSFDDIRKSVQDTWYAHDPDLRCGDVTYGWVHHAYKTCRTVQNLAFQQKIETPCLFAIPEHEDLVDNQKTKDAVENLQNASLIEYKDAAHELLMEKDAVRNDFLENFYKLIKETIIDRPETLKPF